MIQTSKITQPSQYSGINITSLNNNAKINVSAFNNLKTLNVISTNDNIVGSQFDFNNFPNINSFSSDASERKSANQPIAFEVIGGTIGIESIVLSDAKLSSIVFKNPQYFQQNIKLTTIPTGLNYFNIQGNNLNGNDLTTILVSFSGMANTNNIVSGYLNIAPEIAAQSLQLKNPADNSEYTDAWISPDGRYQLISQLDEFTPPNTTSFGNIWLSTNFGIDFAPLDSAGRNFWRSVSASSGIKYICAVQRNGKAYLSSNSGVSFDLINTGMSTTRNEKMDYTDCAMSYDGKYINLTATQTLPTYPSGNVFLSSDFGVSFRVISGVSLPYPKTQDTVKWRSTSMSSGGRYQNICIGGNNAGNVYVSSDFGSTWQSTQLGLFFGLTETFRDIATSSNGQYMTVNGNAIYTSENYGVNWKLAYVEDRAYRPGFAFYAYLPDADFNGGISMSADGKNQVSCLTSKVNKTKYPYVTERGYVLTSSNYGKNWSKLNYRDFWGCVALSPDSQYLLIGSESGQFYTSRTDGADTTYGSTLSTAYNSANWLRDNRDWEVTYINNFFS